MGLFKTTWESVSPLGPGSRYYDGERPNTHPSQVDDEYWHTTEVEHDGTERRMGQYRTLKRRADSGEELIRNVRLFQYCPDETDEIRPWKQQCPDEEPF